jgi:hypothetical protein
MIDQYLQLLEIFLSLLRKITISLNALLANIDKHTQNNNPLNFLLQRWIGAQNQHRTTNPGLSFIISLRKMRQSQRIGRMLNDIEAIDFPMIGYEYLLPKINGFENNTQNRERICSGGYYHQNSHITRNFGAL